MEREVRHPYQIMDIDELVVGETYVFAGTEYEYGSWVDYLVFGGIVDDSKNAHDQASLKVFVDPPKTEKSIFLIHRDGWNRFGGSDVPTITYWRGDGSWDKLTTFFGPRDDRDARNEFLYIIVPIQYWSDDPQIYNHPVERLLNVERVMTEAEMKKRYDKAMAKALGF